MKKLLLLALTVFTALPIAFAQQISRNIPLLPLSELQQSKLAAVPRLKMPETRSPLLLPVSVDNSALPYFRPLFTQSGLECGQASSIGLGLTYELDLKRQVPANLTQNQYATYFTYDFLNGGSDAGVSFLESWEIVKRCGNPSVLDYGGLSYGGSARWMSGYDKYYNAMHNRITDVYSISLSTADGINTLKSWIYNHMNASAPGGVAHFYSQYGAVTTQLPTGTPEAGKYVITSWGSSPNHAMTILGYNDSIRFDYNGDGQFTNDVDINGDGIVDVRDWEIGGFKIANTYGNVTNWANQGFSWAMYRSFAESSSSGGIWENLAYIAYAKQNVDPKLTMKVTLKHSSRNKIKIMAGVAKNLSATEPEVTLNLPIFDFLGGDKFMQGGTTEADKTIEFGLDATPLLSEITSGQPAKFFLLLQENDPSNQATGSIISYELIDYTSGAVSIPCASSNVPIVENGLTSLSVTATINVSQPAITSVALPEARIYEPYSQQMTASGGTTPYKWQFVNDYSETRQTAVFPSVTAQQLSVTNSSSGYATRDLPFAFPFYGKIYTKVYPHVDGYLMFDNLNLPWPYIIYEKTYFKDTRSISPYMSKPLILTASEGDGIWYQGDQNSATFRWKASMSGMSPATDLNFSVTLYPNGNIDFNYGSITSPDYISWIAGISNGDGVNYHFAAITDSLAEPVANTMTHLVSQPFPTEMSISGDGLFSGTPLHAYQNLPIRFYAEDNNFLYTTKTLNFSTKGVELAYTVNSGGDSIIEYGETAHLTAVLKNISSSALHNVVLKLSVNDPFISLTDSTESIGTLMPGQTMTFPDACKFNVSNAVPDGHPFNLHNQIVADEDTYYRNIPQNARSANILVSSVTVADGNNNILMPGETANLLITLKNTGGSRAVNMAALLSTIDPGLSILQGSAAMDTLKPNISRVLTFQIKASASCPARHVGFMMMHLSADKEIQANDSIFVNIGPVVEDFETGDFSRYPWHLNGNVNWSVSNVLPYEGTYCAASGTMIDNQQCNMYLTMDFLSGSDISFYRKVSSETNYDFLYFYVDGVEFGKWSGEVPWGKVTYTVGGGVHTLKWAYSKDYSVSSGSDKAWVDYISWPPISTQLFIVYGGPDGTDCSSEGYQLSATVVNASSLWWTSSGDGSFTGGNSVNAIYHPGNTDQLVGSAILTIHAMNNSQPIMSDNLTLTILPSPMANAGPDRSVCPGNSIALTLASATSQNSVLWTTAGDGIFNNPSLINPVYNPGSNDIAAGSVILTMTASGLTACAPTSDALTLTILPAMFANAGIDKTVSYGASTQLNGSCSGGSGNFTASWSPANLLVYPFSFTPLTVNLSSSALFTLTVTDAGSGCISTDQMSVIVTGGPLSVTVFATPQQICAGDSSHLSTLAGGGSGSYTYQWSSNPPGYASSLPNPLVYPDSTTTYYVSVYDGSATANGQVTVSVNSLPLSPGMPAGPTYVNLLAGTSSDYTSTGSPNASQYLWHFSPAAAGNIVASGPACQVQWNAAFSGTAFLWVNALNNCGESNSSDTLRITAGNQIGMPGTGNTDELVVYPNPSDGSFKLSQLDPGTYELKVYNAEGKNMVNKVICVQFRGEIQILNLSQFAKGMYFLNLKNNLHRYTRKLSLIPL